MLLLLNGTNGGPPVADTVCISAFDDFVDACGGFAAFGDDAGFVLGNTGSCYSRYDFS